MRSSMVGVQFALCALFFFVGNAVLPDSGLSKEQKEEITKAFSQFDSDGDGKITIDDLQEKMLATGMSLDELKKMVSTMDKNGNGKIEFEEFFKFMAASNDADEEELSTVFNTFDKDRDGLISADDLREILKQLRMKHTPDVISKMMEKADFDGDGVIDYDEFRTMINNAE